MSEQHATAITLIFDGACGFCSRSVRWILSRDRAGRIVAVPSQQSGVLEQFGLTRAEANQAAWAVSAQGERFRGAAAINRALAETGSPLSVLARLYRFRPLAWLENFGYRGIANHRHQLSRLWGEAACAVPTSGGQDAQAARPTQPPLAAPDPQARRAQPTVYAGRLSKTPAAPSSDASALR
jgi:predicted DCC family thiol-disulfide oxidoreductase YuxK